MCLVNISQQEHWGKQSANPYAIYNTRVTKHKNKL